MKLSCKTILPMFLAGILITAPFGCTGPQVLATATYLVVGTVTGDADTALQAAKDVYVVAESEQRRQLLLSQLPAEWQCSGSDLYQDETGCYIYAHPDRKTWYKYVGGMWIDPDADVAQIAVASTEIPLAPRAAPAPKPAPAMKPAVASAPEPSSEEKPLSPSEASRLKREQGLEGVLFQDSKSKTWYLEDEENTYKLKKGKFIKI